MASFRLGALGLPSIWLKGYSKFWKMSFTQFDDAVPPGVTNLRMGSPAVKTLKKSALIMKNAAELKLVDMINAYLM